jgi:hypothetical protein
LERLAHALDVGRDRLIVRPDGIGDEATEGVIGRVEGGGGFGNGVVEVVDT